MRRTPSMKSRPAGRITAGHETDAFVALAERRRAGGGALLPFLDADIKSHPCGWHAGWGVDPREIEALLKSLETTFQVTHESYNAPEAHEGLLPSFIPRIPKWPAFAKRSTANIYRDKIATDPNLHIILDATIIGFRMSNRRITGVIARGESGQDLEISTGRVAITAGAIESTRILLLFNRAHGGSVFPSESPLGKGFHDHLSAPIATLAVRKTKPFLRLFSFAFKGGGMRNLRFELSPEVRTRLCLPAAFAHIAFTRKEQSGFDGLRRAFQAAQQNKLPALSDLRAILADLPWFVRAVWWRFVEKRVLPPKGASFELHLVTEQKPDPENTITLSDACTDRFGLPMAKIDWKISDEDRGHLTEIANMLVEEWNAGPLGSLAEAIPRPDHEIGLHVMQDGGIFHPAGTTKLGPDELNGVVDTNLRVHGVDGLWLVATSVFPSVGGSSPSLGALQLGLRAATDIVNMDAGTPPPGKT